MKLIALVAVLSLASGQVKVPLRRACDISWLKYENFHAENLVEKQDIATEKGCQLACEEEGDCWSFDFDFSDNSCWLGSACQPERVALDSVNHWDLSKTCTVPTGDSCAVIHRTAPGAESGIYSLTLPGRTNPVPVYCDMDTAGGGWTVFQRRKDGSVDFYKVWSAYAVGFGKLDGEFWLGNDIIASLTAGQQYKLRIDLGDWEGNYRYAEYSLFKIADASDRYRLVGLGTYSGDAGDSLTYHKGRQFSTYDQDNDIAPGYNCASACHGAWWYGFCQNSGLNGEYNNTASQKGVVWKGWLDTTYSLRFSEMKIRPVTF